jgi:hypothetical protein
MTISIRQGSGDVPRPDNNSIWLKIGHTVTPYARSTTGYLNTVKFGVAYRF